MAQPETPVDISFVVIGYNEGHALGACLSSVRDARMNGLSSELIYVDGGSTDDSMSIACAAGADHVIGGDRRRRAAENRNLGLARARGRYIQFVDGDMKLDAAWIPAGIALLEARPEAAVVWGELRETRPSRVYQAMELDWEFAEGPTRYCGGAALFRRAPLLALGGFPEDLPYGEEPYLCWRIRNELGLLVWHLHRPMAEHDLDYGGFGGYLRRTAHCGEAYAAVAARCLHSRDRLWLREAVNNLAWSAGLLAAGVLLVAGNETLRLTALAFLAAVLGRKFFQYVLRGHAPHVSALYALHTYAAKLIISYGILTRMARNLRKAK